jgi:hypothetical protein
MPIQRSLALFKPYVRGSLDSEACIRLLRPQGRLSQIRLSPALETPPVVGVTAGES